MQNLKLSNNNVKEKINRFIDYTGLSIIGVLSLGYALFYNNIAKWHIYLPCVKAPFFIGEMAWVICFILFLAKWLINSKKTNLITCLFLFYSIFVIIKTITGYFYWGPLSLRHSVLFSYPFFAVFGYSFYRNYFFKPNKSLFLILTIIFIFRFFSFYPYFVLTCFILTLILINAYPKSLLRYTLYFLLLLSFPYKFIFLTSRTFITSNLFAIIYMSLGFLYVSRIKSKYKIILFLFFISFAFYGIIKISNRNEVKSLVGFGELSKRYNEQMEILRIKEPTFVEQKLNVKLYNEENVWIQKFGENRIKESIESQYIGLKNKASKSASLVVENSIAPESNFKHSNKMTASLAVDKDESSQLRLDNLSNKNEKKEGALAVKIQEADSIVASYLDIIASVEHRDEKEEEAINEKKEGVLPVKTKEVGTFAVSSAVIEATPKNKDEKDKNTLNKEVKEVNGVKKTNSVTFDMETKEENSIPPAWDRGVTPYGNSLFRVFIWKDVFEQLRIKRPIFGFDFGKPFRSRTLEILNYATGEWSRDGWICIHNSYIDIVYRAGVMGILMIIFILITLIFIAVNSFKSRSLTGILLNGILINWFIAANFLEILEMPYSAIPLWSLFGLTFAYLSKIRAL